jgi:hypothetical protein
LIDVKNTNAYLHNKNENMLLHCAAESGESNLVVYPFNRYRKLTFVIKREKQLH